MLLVVLQSQQVHALTGTGFEQEAMPLGADVRLDTTGRTYLPAFTGTRTSLPRKSS